MVKFAALAANKADRRCVKQAGPSGSKPIGDRPAAYWIWSIV
jgi:hypothetical protein